MKIFTMGEQKKFFNFIKIFIIFICVFSAFFSFPPFTFSAPPATNNSVAWITNGTVYGIVQRRSTTYIGGEFTFVGPSTGYGVPVSTSTGVRESTFPKIDENVYAVISDGSDGWYVGGSFSKVGDSTRNNIAHILSNGTLDSSWNPNANNTVRGLLLSPDGTILYVAGSFTNIGGQSRNYLAAISTTTGSATDWNPNMESFTGYYAESLVLTSDGSVIYIGGRFASAGGQARRNAAALNTTTAAATSWNPSTNTSGYIHSLVLSSDGTTVYAGGEFTTIGGQSRNRIAALDTTNGTATSWNPNSNDRIYSLALTSDGSIIYAGGRFTTIGGQSRNKVAAISTSTGNASDFNPNANGQANVVKLNSDGSKLYIGGAYDTMGGISRGYVSAVNTSDGSLTSWDPSAGDSVVALAFNSDQSIIFIGGYFYMINGKFRDRIASFNTETGNVTDWNPTANGIVYSITANSDGSTIYTGGAFTTIGGQSRSHIAAINDSGEATSFNPSANSGGYPYGLVLNSDESILYTAGFFTTIGGQARTGFAALSTSTGNATDWNPNASNTGFGLALNSDESLIYVSGWFTSIGGQTRNRIAALSTSTGLATDWNPNANGAVEPIKLNSDESLIYAGGVFTSIGGQTRNRIAAINASTGLATDWNPNADDEVESLAISSDDNTIYAGGWFENIGGQARTYLAALDASTGNADDWNPNVGEGDVYAMLLSSNDDALYIGGSFFTIGTSYYMEYAGFAQFGTYPTTTPTSTPTPSPTSAPSSTVVHTGVSDGKGGKGSNTDPHPTDAPDLFQIDTTEKSATLYFTPVSGLITSYTIAYGYTINDKRFSITFNQGATGGVIKYTINYLTPNTEYYFTVRGNYNKSPGKWSNVLSATTNNNSYFQNFTPTLIPSVSPKPAKAEKRKDQKEKKEKISELKEKLKENFFAPIISIKKSCLEKAETGTYIADVSWTNPKKPDGSEKSVRYMDISSDKSFKEYYHKWVSGINQTSVSEGFTKYRDKNKNLTIEPEITYYVRLFGGKHSQISAFKIPKCESLTPTPTPSIVLSPTPKNVTPTLGIGGIPGITITEPAKTTSAPTPTTRQLPTSGIAATPTALPSNTPTPTRRITSAPTPTAYYLAGISPTSPAPTRFIPSPTSLPARIPTTTQSITPTPTANLALPVSAAPTISPSATLTVSPSITSRTTPSVTSAIGGIAEISITPQITKTVTEETGKEEYLVNVDSVNNEIAYVIDNAIDSLPAGTGDVLVQGVVDIRDVPQSTTVEQTAKVVAVSAASVVVSPSTFVSLFSSISTIKDIPLFILRYIFLIPQFFGFKKKSKPWGVVFDSITKQPIDPAIVTLYKKERNVMKKIGDKITDMEGKFGFLVEKGVYYLKAIKTNFAFPSEILKGKTEDGERINLYFGQELQIENPDLIKVDIPMDPLRFDWNQVNKPAHYKPPLFIFSSGIVNTATWLGFLLTIIAYTISPSSSNLIMIFIYALFMMLRVLIARQRKWGTVYNGTTMEVLPLVKVRAVMDNGITAAQSSTDALGRYYTYLNEGVYSIQIEKETGQGTQILKKVGPITVNKNRTSIAPDIKI